MFKLIVRSKKIFKKISKKILYCLLILLINNSYSNNLKTQVNINFGKTARQLVGWQWQINRPDLDPCVHKNYGALYMLYEFQRTFDNNHIAQTLFGSKKLRFSGSLVKNRSNRDLIADNFGLSRTGTAELNFDPQITNNIFDLGFYLGLEGWYPGLYFEMHLPFVHTHWKLRTGDLKCKDEILKLIGECDPQINACYDNSNAKSPADTAAAADNLHEALSGHARFGDMHKHWEAGKFHFNGRRRTRVGDVDLMLGYNWFNNSNYEFATFIIATLNGAGRPKEDHVFEPQIGLGHVQLGAGIFSRALLYDNNNSNLAVFIYGFVTHLFENKQNRLFDLKHNGDLSRYILLKEYSADGDNFNYSSRLYNGSEFSTRDAKVKIDIYGDASIKLAFRTNSLGLDLGYSIVGQSKEKIKLSCEGCLEQRNFAVKGTSDVCNFDYPNKNPIRDNSAQPNANMFNVLSSENSIIPKRFLSDSDLDIKSAQAEAVLLHKIFTHISYSWLDNSRWNPNIGIGGEVGFNNKNYKNNSFWGIWAKGCLSF